MPLRQSKEVDEVRTLARARTLTVLERLDSERKSRVLQFLYESGLIKIEHTIVDLWGADLNDADLSGADLSEARLEGADLGKANLRGANLNWAYMPDAKGVTNEELKQLAYSLKAATMPNNEKDEEWLKSKDRREDGGSGP